MTTMTPSLPDRVRAAWRDVTDRSSGHVRTVDGPLSATEKRRVAVFALAFIPTVVAYGLGVGYFRAVGGGATIVVAARIVLWTWDRWRGDG